MGNTKILAQLRRNSFRGEFGRYHFMLTSNEVATIQTLCKFICVPAIYHFVGIELSCHHSKEEIIGALSNPDATTSEKAGEEYDLKMYNALLCLIMKLTGFNSKGTEGFFLTFPIN